MIFKDLNKLSKIIEVEKKSWKSIIWTNWCFDIMHPWHMATFTKCRELADIVIVWLNWDKSPYWKTKPWRPINDEHFRSEMLNNLKNVDYIYIFDDETASEPVSILKPNYVLKGWDYIQESIKHLVKEEKWIVDLTEAYKQMITNWIEKYRWEKWFIIEGEINVKNWNKLVVVPTIKWYSTSNIINKIKS